MRPKLAGTNIAVLDIGDQPQTQYVLFVGGFLGDRVGIGIDYLELKHDGKLAAGFRFGEPGQLVGARCVIQWNPALPWAIVHRGTVELVTGEQYYRKLDGDEKAVQALDLELNPPVPGKKPKPRGGQQMAMVPILSPIEENGEEETREDQVAKGQRGAISHL